LSKQFITSKYDFPQFIWTILGLGSVLQIPEEEEPFIVFFSGHTAILVMYWKYLLDQGQSPWLAKVYFVGNVLQIIRLLATRGHYSIDIIIGAGVGYSVHYLHRQLVITVLGHFHSRIMNDSQIDLKRTSLNDLTHLRLTPPFSSTPRGAGPPLECFETKKLT